MSLSIGFSTSVDSQAELAARARQLPTLLVVDDEKDITASLADLFRRDYHVLSAASADEALTILNKHDVSVIVSDQRMPGKTGSELLAEACLIDPDAVRILLTGYADIGAVVQAVNEGKIFFYLTKPWSSKEIQAVVAKAVEHNFLLRDNRRLVEELRQINAELEERVTDRTAQLNQRATDLETALSQVKKLEGIIPICMYCKKIRNDEEAWQNMEHYISEHSDAEFSHGICPVCFEKNFGKQGQRING
ncbi:MAG: response regulator [Deltaproteobacteria bacterium]|nr:response regulator [Deltaproteobacteria bacterium]